MHLIPSLDPGGAEGMLSRLVANMDKDKFENLVVSMTDIGAIGGAMLSSGIRVTNLRMARGMPSPLAIPRLVRILRKERPDILQTWLYHADVLGTVAARLAPVPVLVWNIRCSNMDMRHYSWLSAAVVRIAAKMSRNPDVIICNATSAREFHARFGYRPRRWEIIPNGFDTNVFRPRSSMREALRAQLGIEPETYVVGTVARYDPMKDHKTLLHGIKYVADRGFNIALVLIGSGADRENGELAAMINHLGMTEVVIPLGVRRDVADLVAGLDLFVLSSAFGEGFPNAVGEAMACGIPCVVTDVGDSAHVVGGVGTVVPANDPIALGKACCDLLSASESNRRVLGEVARKRVEEYFALEHIVQRYQSLYQSLTSRCACERQS